jgi:hypothetical protein
MKTKNNQQDRPVAADKKEDIKIIFTKGISQKYYPCKN